MRACASGSACVCAGACQCCASKMASVLRLYMYVCIWPAYAVARKLCRLCLPFASACPTALYEQVQPLLFLLLLLLRALSTLAANFLPARFYDCFAFTVAAAAALLLLLLEFLFFFGKTLM